MREITTHKVNGLNNRLVVAALDEPGHGNACHVYRIDDGGDSGEFPECSICFQNGPVPDGVNGVTHEAILAVLIDRLQGFQSGPFACRENAIALTKLEEAVHWLKHRTESRLARGVEGTHAK